MPDHWRFQIALSGPGPRVPSGGRPSCPPSPLHRYFEPALPPQPAEYELCRGAKALDSSLPWRLLRLPNNCSLELVRTRKSGAAGASAPRGGTAKLAVSLPSGSRVIVEPSIDATLADVLRGLDALGHFPAGADLAGASCLVVRRSVPPEALATTSLRGEVGCRPTLRFPASCAALHCVVLHGQRVVWLRRLHRRRAPHLRVAPPGFQLTS